MNDRIQAEPPPPNNPLSERDEHPEVDLRNRPTGVYDSVAKALTGILLVVPAVAAVHAANPSIASPFPLILDIPLFSGLPTYLVVWIGPVLFWLASHSLSTARPMIPPLLRVAIWGCVGLNALALVMGWSYGVQYQGVGYTVAVATISTTLALVVGTLDLISTRKREFDLSLAT